MDKGLKDFVKQLFINRSGDLVGKLCKQIEVLQAQPNLSKETKEILSILKGFKKELIYEHFRDTQNAIVFYLEGRSYTKYPIYTPPKNKK